MPEADKYFEMLLNELSQIELQADLLWIRLDTHLSTSTCEDILNQRSCNFADSLKKGVDCFLVTGAPVEHLNFSEILYWSELTDILNYFRRNSMPALGLCWGALAIAETLGLEKKYLKPSFMVYLRLNI